MSELVMRRVTEFAQSLLPSMELELYDVQFRREAHGWVLRLVIDRIGGVSLDDCSRVSREISDYLDVEDLIDHAYHLEVSSPGAERALRSLQECRRFIGEKVRIKTREEMDGQKVFVGYLEEINDDSVVVATDDDNRYTFLWQEIKQARLTL